MKFFNQKTHYLIRSLGFFLCAIFIPFVPKIYFYMFNILPTALIEAKMVDSVSTSMLPSISGLVEFLVDVSYGFSAIYILFSLFYIFRYFSKSNSKIKPMSLKFDDSNIKDSIKVGNKNTVLNYASKLTSIVLDNFTVNQGLGINVSRVATLTKDKYTIAVEEKNNILKSKFSSISNSLNITREKHFNCNLIFSEKLPLIVKNYQNMPESFRSDPVHFDEIMKQLSLIELLLQDTVKDISDMKKVEAKNITKYFENKVQEINE